MAHSVSLVIAGSLVVLAATGANGQGYPNRPIRIVTPGSGGGNDFIARLVGQRITATLGQQIVVDNRPGGVIPAEVVAQAAPDGYTLLSYGTPLWLLPLMQKTSYDVRRDFSPITLAVVAPNILVIHPAVPATSVKELIALAKAKPGVINFGTGGSGGASHLASELFKSMAQIDIVQVNYKSYGAAITDLMSGQVQMMFSTAASVLPQMKSGRLRALAVASARPSALAPDLPTIAAAGLPGFEAVSFFGLFAPKGTPEAIIKRLNQEVNRVLAIPDVKEKFFNTGLDVVGTTPEEFATTINNEINKWGKIIKDASIRME